MTEFLPTPSARDFDVLRQARRSRVWQASVVAALVLIGLFFLGLTSSFLLRSQIGSVTSPQLQRLRLAELQQPWSSGFLRERNRYHEWFVRHGTLGESTLFDGVAGVVIDSMLNSNSAAVAEGDLSTFGRTFLAIHTGIVRVLFFIIASARLWFVIALFALVQGLRSWRPYVNSDALGQMGNGRVFYSGVRADLESVTAQGVPDQLIRGFACPQASSVQEAKSSELWRIVSEYQVTSPTNLALIQIIVRYKDTAAYVAAPGEEERLVNAFVDIGLLRNTAEILKEALAIHADYAAQVRCDDRPTESSFIENDRGVPYAERVASAFHRVVTPRMRMALGAVSAAEIATLILAFESGKVLAHSFEGQRWVRRSSFPHLSARAVLHSLVEYPQDYDVSVRNRLRRALVYAARRSPFAPIRLPVDCEDEVLALRQWTEVLLACPNELPEVAVELELFAVLREAHAVWLNRFFDPSSNDFSVWQSCSYTTETDLLFVPLSSMVTSLRSTVDPSYVARMQALVSAVALKQRQAESASLEGENPMPPTSSIERVYAVPVNERIQSLATMHGVSCEDMRDWLILRHVLSSFGWLASRVGDYTVPETSAVFAVFQGAESLLGADSSGRLGMRGMVPIRGSKVRERLGVGWAAQSTHVDRVTIAERELDFERLLQGIEELAPSDEGEESPPVAEKT